MTFLSASPKWKVSLPLVGPKGAFKVVGVGPREVFSVRYALGGGRFGDSVTFIEQELGMTTTSRNYSTVVKIAAMK